MKKRIWGAVAFGLVLSLIVVLPLIFSGTAKTDDFVTPSFWKDFSVKGSDADCTDPYHVSVAYNPAGYVSVTFADSEGNGTCFDPYMTLTLPGSGIDCRKYPCIALLLRTNKGDKQGELRFRTDKTGAYYPCQRFTYQATGDWEVVVIRLTDPDTVLYVDESAKDFSGCYTNLRLDMFENDCANDTSYDLRAFAFYENEEDAKTLAAFVKAQQEDSKDDTEKLLEKNRSFPKGAEFTVPSMQMRMRYVSYGFDRNYQSAIDALLARGYGGIVSNVPFDKNYLKDDASFALLKDAYAYARVNGMSAWIYDEYQWPSGRAFGMVLDGHDDYEATGIQHRVKEGNGTEASYTIENAFDIFLYAAVLTDEDGMHTLDCKGQTMVSASAKGAWTLDVYVLRHAYEGEEDRSDFTKLRDVDLLNKNAVARFIQLTYEKYKAEFGNDFGYVEAFFTDEPQLGNRGKADYIVWTAGLDSDFQSLYGEQLDITAIFSGDNVRERRMRMQYYRLVAAKFKAAYTDQLTAFCQANGMYSSGHFLFEENMNDQIETYGGDFLQIVGGMGIPGADILWTDPAHLLNQNANIGNFVGLRYVASAARNAGKTRVMVEYNPAAVLTEEFSTDPISTSIGGLTLTRLLGCTDYNVINPQNNYTTEQMNRLNTYLGRMNTVLDGAHESGDLAVFYPIATVQALHNADDVHSSEGGKTSDATVLNDNFTSLCKTLLQKQLLYTVIDDASVCDAVITKDGRMVIGNGSYRVLVIAYADYISANAARKLQTFVKAGGKVVFVGSVPQYGLEEKEDADVKQIMDLLAAGDSCFFKKTGTTAINAIANAASKSLKIEKIKGFMSKALLMGDFENETQDITFVVNTTDTDGNLTLSYADGYKGEFLLYFPGSGEIRKCTDSADVVLPAYEGVFFVRVSDNTRDDAPYEETDARSDETTDVETPDGDDSTASETSAPATTVADSTSAATTDAGTRKNGCGSAVQVFAAATVAVFGAVVCFKKRKE